MTDWYILTDENYTPPLKTNGPKTAQPTTEKAVATTSTVLVNGRSTAFEAYNIKGNNYFKLRDLAQAVNNTEKNFEVTWDGATNTVGIDTSISYVE